MTKTYAIEVDCPNCANKMEFAASKVEGVESVAVSFMALKMTVTFCPNVNETEVMKKVIKACKKIESDCVIYL